MFKVKNNNDDEINYYNCEVNNSTVPQLEL